MRLFERIFIHCDGWRTCMDVLLPHNSCRPLSLTALTKANSLDWNKKGNWWSICGGIVIVLHCTGTYQQFVDVRYRQGHNVLIGRPGSCSKWLDVSWLQLVLLVRYAFAVQNKDALVVLVWKYGSLGKAQLIIVAAIANDFEFSAKYYFLKI